MIGVDVQRQLEQMDDSALLAWLDESVRDLQKAADESPNSEWHEACFAAAYLFASEANRRGLKRASA